MEPLIVIGVRGKAGSGKDTVCDILRAHYGAQRIALGDGPRAALRDLDGPTWEYSKESGAGPRVPLQVMGNECRADLLWSDSQRRLWIGTALAKVRYAHTHHTKPRYRFVVPDIRHDEEPIDLRAQIEAWGGRFHLWDIVRDGAGLTGEAAKHRSETELERSQIKPDALIFNNHTRRKPLIESLERLVPSEWRV